MSKRKQILQSSQIPKAALPSCQDITPSLLARDEGHFYLSTFSLGKLSGIKALVFKVTAPSFHFSSDAAQGMTHEVSEGLYCLGIFPLPDSA
jgi:hypothetical protein